MYPQPHQLRLPAPEFLPVHHIDAVEVDQGLAPALVGNHRFGLNPLVERGAVHLCVGARLLHGGEALHRLWRLGHCPTSLSAYSARANCTRTMASRSALSHRMRSSSA